MFFSSWQLWEQMTFVLGCAIVAVFIIGYVKLLWVNRYVRKQELMDEEKRERIAELRNSGQIVESSKGHDIPFGVRAIQSGIQVDGIWISNSNTPVPSELGLDRLPTGSDHGRNAPQKAERQNTPRGRTPRRNDHANSNPLLDNSPYDQADLGSTLQSYKPRKSSHLRYNSYGDTRYDDDTLAHLEGTASPIKKKVHSHRPRGSRGTDLEDSSAADNEHSSGGSSDSDNTLSGNLNIPGSRQSRYSPIRNGSQGDIGPVIAMVPSGRPTRESFPFPTAKSEYAQIPLGESPNYEGSDPFLTPQATPPAGSYLAHSLHGQVLGSVEGYVDYQPLQQSGRQTPPIFVPGELHVNKQVRKVNSGFEVLPAGTFGAPARVRSNDNQSEEDSGERRKTKLQKKSRPSISSRPSDPSDHA